MKKKKEKKIKDHWWTDPFPVLPPRPASPYHMQEDGAPEKRAKGFPVHLDCRWQVKRERGSEEREEESMECTHGSAAE